LLAGCSPGLFHITHWSAGCSPVFFHLTHWCAGCILITCDAYLMPNDCYLFGPLAAVVGPIFPLIGRNYIGSAIN
jgi:hypothetical protein